MTEGITRRMLVGGGAGVGLIVAWGLWPRHYAPTLVANPGESLFGAWLKIGSDGHVTVAVPQAEHGQGVYTTLPQIVADELGADWRTVGVEAAPLNPLYANPIGMDELFEGAFDALPESVRGAFARRSALTLTAASSSIRMFEDDCRTAGSAARALLCMAAAKRWDADWTQCVVEAGFVTLPGKSEAPGKGKAPAKRVRFAEIAAEAAGGRVPDPLPVGVQGAGKLIGISVPRIDTPSKVDGSATFAGDLRLADMVHAAIRQGPAGSRLDRVDRAGGERIRGLLSVVENPYWVAAVATTGWAAQRALDALHPRFVGGAAVDSASIDAALAAAHKRPGKRMAKAGNVDAVLKGAQTITATYRAGFGAHASIETLSATAVYREGRLELWLATQAPGLARAAAARAAGIGEDAVVVHPMLIGGSFGAALEHQVAEQAAVLAVKLKRPVSLVWSRGEDSLHDRCRAPAMARMTARLAPNGAILGWSAKIAAPATGAELARRMMPGPFTDGGLALGGSGDAYAVAGALPPYRIPACAIDHHVAEIGVPTGHLRGGAHGYTAFFTECFLDELAHAAGSEPMSYRIGMLGGQPRLARCLSTAAALGGWGGGVAGSGQGIACHAFRGSHVAVLAEAHIGDDQRPVVERLVAAVDCGRTVNPDVVRQQIEGGLIFGMANALGASTGFSNGLADTRGFDRLALPRLDDIPDITVEVIRSDEAPGGVSEIGVPAVAPAIANALMAATGSRLRALPLGGGR